jgi:hypothetical protein
MIRLHVPLRRVRHRHLGKQPPRYAIEQRTLVCNMTIKGHRLHTEFRAETPHRERGDSVRVGNPDRRVENDGPAQRLTRRL